MKILAFSVGKETRGDGKRIANMMSTGCFNKMHSMFKGPFRRSVFKDPIFGSENWKQAFRRSDFKVPFLW